VPNFNSIGSRGSEPQMAVNRSPIDLRHYPYNNIKVDDLE